MYDIKGYGAMIDDSVRNDAYREALRRHVRPGSVVLDIGTFFWEEVAAAAERLLYDVFQLAPTYGWSESDILAMGAARREYYLKMVSR